MPRTNRSRLYKAQCDDRERRLVALAKYRAERRKLCDYAKDMGINIRTAQKDQREYVRRLTMTTDVEISIERQRVMEELNALKVDLLNPKIDPDKKVGLALAIIDREVDLLGLNAPTRSESKNLNVNLTEAPLALAFYDRMSFEWRGVPVERWEDAFLALRTVLQQFKPAQKPLKEEVAEICQRFLPASVPQEDK
jgi:hypothetical protein